MDAEPGSPVDRPSLRAATAQGFLWTIGQTVVVRLLSLIGFVVLARLLTPEDYGVAALAIVFMTLLYVVGNAGMGPALIQRETVDETDLDTVFWIGTLGGLALAVLLTIVAGPLADVFDEPELQPVLQLLSLGFVFIGLGSTQSAVLQRKLAFRAIARSTLIANLVATVVGIAFAVAGLGVYALVIQTLLATILVAIAHTVQSGYRPGRNVSPARFRELFASSRAFFGHSFLAFTNTRTDDFLIGATLGAAPLGVYSVGYRVLTILLDLLTTGARRVAFPVFSRVQGERARLGLAYASGLRMAGVLAFPSFLFVLVAAPIIIPAVFGAKWEASVPVMQILCLFGPLHALVQFNTALLQSIGRARLVFRIGLAGTVLQVALFAIAVNFGIEWVAAAFVIRAYLVAPVSFVAASRELDARLRDNLAGVMAPAAASGFMAGAVWLAHQALDEQLPGGALLVVLVAVGALSYAVALRFVGPAVFAEAVDYLRSAVSRATHPGAARG